MIRASSLHRITTNRPFFDAKAFSILTGAFKEKCSAKKIKFKPGLEFAEKMLYTPGLKTISEKVIKSLKDKELSINDPLPKGAKTALQELYLEREYGFYNMSVNDNDPALKKGILIEDKSIAFLGDFLGLSLVNNKDRVSNEVGFLTGEADILYDNIVRDIKSPLNWSTFRKKDGIEIAYHWQLVAYCLLYGKTEAYLDYVLMPMPESMIIDMTRKMSSEGVVKFVEYNHQIALMPPEKRIKTYQVDSSKLKKDMEFAKVRLMKAKAYYKTLDYNICMKMI